MELHIGSIDRYLGKNQPAHAHTCYEVILYSSGRGTLRTEEKDYAVGEGMVAILPPQVKHHTVLPDEGIGSIYIGSDFDGLFRFTEPIIFREGEKRDSMVLARLILENYYAKPEYCEALAIALAHYILKSLTIKDSVELAVGEVVREITLHYREPDLNLSALLNQSGYTEDYIRACFKRSMGKTPNGFLTELRIHQACHLIDMYKNTLSLTEVAEWSGYADYVYFSKRFKQVMGLTPQQYKKKTVLN